MHHGASHRDGHRDCERRCLIRSTDSHRDTHSDSHAHPYADSIRRHVRLDRVVGNACCNHGTTHPARRLLYQERLWVHAE